MPESVADSSNTGKYSLGDAENIRSMDPLLQNLILRSREEQALNPIQAAVSADSEAAPIVDLIIGLDKPPKDPLDPLPSEIKENIQIQNPVLIGSRHIFGQASVKEIESVHSYKDNNIISSLKAPKPVGPVLDTVLRDVKAGREIIREAFPDFTPFDGTGVIIGIVDFDGDFSHPNFCIVDQQTGQLQSRLSYFWNQGIPGTQATSPQPYNFGVEYDNAQLNQFLGQADPLGNYPNMGDEGHGTHVMDIAAGNGRALGTSPGIAPNAELIFVHLGNPDYLAEESLGNSARLAAAVGYIFRKADEREAQTNRPVPVIVNLSLSTNGGAHDGSTPAERAFDDLLREKPGRAIVIAAGNEYNVGIHTSGRVATDNPATFQWHVRDPQCLNPGPRELEMEIWYSGQDEFQLVITPPREQPLPPIRFGPPHPIKINGQTVGRIMHRAQDSINGDNHINIFLDYNEENDGMIRGRWSIELSAILIGQRDTDDEGNEAGLFHAWIERDNCRTSLFPDEFSDPACTLGAIATGELPIVVGAYNVPALRDIADFSSAGPTRDLKEKPEISAPGVGILAARLRTQTRWSMDGTSMAAPVVTGVLALLMQAALERTGNPLDIARIRQLLTKDHHYDPRFGFGRLDTLTLLANLLGVSPVVIASIAKARAQQDMVPVETLTSLIESLAQISNKNNVRLRASMEIEPFNE